MPTEIPYEPDDAEDMDVELDADDVADVAVIANEMVALCTSFAPTAPDLESIIRAIIGGEDPRHPLTDEEIGDEISATYDVALGESSVATTRRAAGIAGSLARRPPLPPDEVIIDLIAELIAGEPADHAYSDDDVDELLADRGIYAGPSRIKALRRVAEIPGAIFRLRARRRAAETEEAKQAIADARRKRATERRCLARARMPRVRPAADRSDK